MSRTVSLQIHAELILQHHFQQCTQRPVAVQDGIAWYKVVIDIRWQVVLHESIRAEASIIP